MAIANPPAAVSDMTPAEARHLRSLEGRIEKGLQTFRDVGFALMEIREDKLFRATHETFEAYCRDRWGLDQARAYQFLGAAEVVKALGDGVEGPVNESQARELVSLVHTDPKAVREVWKDVQATGKPITAAVIREAVQAHSPRPDAPPGTTPTEALVARILAVGTAYAKWLETKPTRGERSAVATALAKLEDMTS